MQFLGEPLLPRQSTKGSLHRARPFQVILASCRAIYTKEPPRTIVKENFCWEDQIENIRDLIRPEEQEDLNKLSNMSRTRLTFSDYDADNS